MEKYSKDAVCPKCGSKDILSSYEEGYKCGCENPDHDRSEHIERFCKNCRYEWQELPLDAEEPDDPVPE